MSGAHPKPWLALVESNTTGSGRDFCAAARARGLRPVLLAARPDRYPYVREDEVESIVTDTADAHAVLAASRRLDATGRVAGVASSSEYFAATAAEVAAALGLPGADAPALSDSRHKDRQRARLAVAGVRVPAFRVAEGAGAAVAAARELGLPVVVKPTTGTGSTGVRLCRDEDEAERHASALLRTPVDERGRPVPCVVLVEEYVTGPELSVETFDGAAVALIAKHLGPEPFFVETGHDCPAPVDAADARTLRDAAERAVRALGVGWGAAHTELRLTATGPVVIEVNARLAGGMIPALVRLAHGVDLVDAVIARACGQPVATAPRSRGCASVRFVQAAGAGTVLSVTGVERARRAPGVALGEVTALPGTDVQVTRSFRDRLGYVVATGGDPRTAADRAASAASLIRISARPAA